MELVSIHQAKTHLSKLIKKANEGKEIVITKRKIPIAKITIITNAKPKRMLGTAKNLIEIMDDFNEPLEDFKDYE